MLLLNALRILLCTEAAAFEELKRSVQYTEVVIEGLIMGYGQDSKIPSTSTCSGLERHVLRVAL
jgi:hypothetical protein